MKHLGRIYNPVFEDRLMLNTFSVQKKKVLRINNIFGKNGRFRQWIAYVGTRRVLLKFST